MAALLLLSGPGVVVDIQADALRAVADAPMPATTICSNGRASLYPCRNIDLISFLPLADIGGGDGKDIWGWTDTATGKEYAIMGRSSGTSFIDISDPVNPRYLGNLPLHDGDPTHRAADSTHHDVKVYKDHAFIVTETAGSGMQIFDLTRLREVTSPPATFSETVHYAGFSDAHNIVINEASGFAYAVGTNTCGGGLHMMNIQEPTTPTSVGCFSADGYTHDAQCVNYEGPDPDHEDKEICFNSNPNSNSPDNTLTIVDVTDKGNPMQLSRTGYQGSGYAHQGWLTDDHAYFLMGDELDERTTGGETRTYIWDVRDLDAPTLIGVHEATTAAVDHNQYVKGSYVYQSNYLAGLRILDLTDIANGRLNEVAFFDVAPDRDDAAFAGTWSNYPFYDSGLVAVSSTERGLFILRPHFLTLSVPSRTVSETAGEVTVTAALSFPAPSGGTTVTLTPTGTATRGIDYTLASTTLTIAQGQTSATTTLTITDDTDDDDNETIILNAASPALTAPTLTLTIAEAPTLAGLTLVAGERAVPLTPPFDPHVAAYRASVAASVTSVTVTPVWTTGNSYRVTAASCSDADCTRTFTSPQTIVSSGSPSPPLLLGSSDSALIILSLSDISRTPSLRHVYKIIVRRSSPPPRLPTPPRSRGGGGGGIRRPADQHGDTPDEATVLTSRRSTIGAFQQRITAHLQHRRDVDTFRLDLPHAGVLTVHTTGEGDTTGQLSQTPAEGGPLLLVTDTDRGPGRNFRLGHAVEPGTYYLAVSAGRRFGDYTLHVHYTPARFENPAPDSFQSGLSVLSGWACEADTVEIEIVPATGPPVRYAAATGTERADTEPVCGDRATGFGLLYNWNRLGAGLHTVRALLNDVVVAEREITVTTLGAHTDEEFRRGLHATTAVPDFPQAGQTTVLRWEEALQNFVIAHGAGGGTSHQLTSREAWLENPASGSFQSGIGVLSGWVCEADTVEIEIVPATGPPQTYQAGYGTERADTESVCGDTDNGFGLLYNWNRLGDGLHTVWVLVDGEAVARNTFTVTTLGEHTDGEFRRGLRGTYVIEDFPTADQTVTVEWQETRQNFVITERE